MGKREGAPELLMLRLDQLRESPSNVRTTYSGLEDLAKSLERHGVMQPLVARPPRGPDGKYELVFGHRRYRAAAIAGLREVPVIVREAEDVTILERQLVENVQRVGLHPMEEAEGYERLRRDFGYGTEEIAAATNKSRATIYAALKLIDLVPAARKAFYAGQLEASTALLLARLKGENTQERALEQLLKTDRRGERMTVREAAAFLQRHFPVDKPRGHVGQELKREQSRPATDDGGRRRREAALRQALGLAVERVQRKTGFEPAELRLMLLALLDAGAGARVAARRGVDERQLRTAVERKLSAPELRGLLFELILTRWVGDPAEEYSTQAKVLAKTFGLSLKDLEAAADQQATAEGLFRK